MEIGLLRVTVDGEERFAVLYDDAGLNTVLGLDGPFTETELRPNRLVHTNTHPPSRRYNGAMIRKGIIVVLWPMLD